ncbi:MAG: LexA family protein [Candidatus Latescibacterota bacterium]
MHISSLLSELPPFTKALIVRYQHSTAVSIPLFGHRIPAGFPSPAEDYLDKTLDLNDLVVKHPSATFFVQVEGDSMIEAGIHTGDVLVVDRALEPADNRIVVAVIDGNFTVKRIQKRQNRLFLSPENPDLDPIEIPPESDFQVWGVVTFVIHRIK